MRKPSAAVLAEREACARIAEEESGNTLGSEASARIAYRIRARSNTAREWLVVPWEEARKIPMEDQRLLIAGGHC